jgi:ribosomal protein L6P/L9E
LKRAIQTVSQGHTRTLLLHGVGFKADIIHENVLSLRIGKKLPCNSTIPDNVHIFIKDNAVHT